MLGSGWASCDVSCSEPYPVGVAMHDDQLQIDTDVARRLIFEQFPDWRHEPIRSVATNATVNAIYRIGTRFAARFPLRGNAPDQTTADLQAGAAALTELSTCCPFPAPEHVAIGRPGHGYPLAWSVQTWLSGNVATPDALARSDVFAADLAALIRALRGADTRGRRFAGSGRGGNLRDHDEWIGLCLRQSERLLEVDQLGRLWERFRSLPRSGRDVMSHGDLIPSNLLVRGERLVGVLDGGGFAPADAALDLVAAWHLLERGPRQTLRRTLGCGSTEWCRGAAWAFQQAIGLVWYYQTTNPEMSALGRSTLARILSDPDLGPHRPGRQRATRAR
jgi:aminoglycoside phosphotransferase (APT) family kinase protein